MKIILNGQPIDFLGTLLSDLLTQHGIDPGRSGVAVAVNGELAQQHRWAEHILADGDRVEVITAMQGG